MKIITDNRVTDPATVTPGDLAVVVDFADGEVTSVRYADVDAVTDRHVTLTDEKENRVVCETAALGMDPREAARTGRTLLLTPGDDVTEWAVYQATLRCARAARDNVVRLSNELRHAPRSGDMDTIAELSKTASLLEWLESSLDEYRAAHPENIEF